MTEKLISFVIPHKGREEFLLDTLRSISRQEFDLSKIEVVLVTQNPEISKDILEFKNNFDLEIIKRPTEISISMSRNCGVVQSHGEYLAFLDADIFISTNWITGMLKKLSEVDSRVIVSAVQINSDNASPLEKIRTALSNAIIDNNVGFLPGRNLFLSRHTFDLVGGFPEHLITCEDYYFTDKANQLGDLYYTSEATYIHLGEDKDFKEMYRKEIWRGQSNLQSIKGRTIPLNEIPSFIIPIALLFFSILFLTAIALAQYPLAVLSLIAILLPVSVYSIRLYLIAQNTVDFKDILKFYLFYFPARAIGTIAGTFRTFTSKSHQ